MLIAEMPPLTHGGVDVRQIEIEAYADVGQPDQGRVALLLRGVPALARTPILQLRPVDPAALADGDGQWPDADIMPTEARVVDDGVELIIGPDITESPALLPGTAVEIESRSCGTCTCSTAGSYSQKQAAWQMRKRSFRRPSLRILLIRR